VLSIKKTYVEVRTAKKKHSGGEKNEGRLEGGEEKEEGTKTSQKVQIRWQDDKPSLMKGKLRIGGGSRSAEEGRGDARSRNVFSSQFSENKLSLPEGLT